MADSKAKHWIVTINNPTSKKEDYLFDEEKLEYVILADEVGESGTPHHQCYACLLRKQRRSYVSKLFPHAFLEPKNGTVAQAINYCKKGEQSHAEWKALGTKGPNYGKNADWI